MSEPAQNCSKKTLNDNDYCIICNTNKKVNICFAECNHTGCCKGCAQNYMLECIKENKFPTCLI